MTPEEFKNLKRGDKIICDNKLIPEKLQNKGCEIVEVAGKEVYNESVEILVFTTPMWGEQIMGWLDRFELPKSDENKWANVICQSDCKYINLVTSVTTQVARGSGATCKVCKEHNLWAENNYPKEDPKIFVCWNCKDSKAWMIPSVI
jgi:hypothetical protein